MTQKTPNIRSFDHRISPLIFHQLPEFVRDQHPKFAAFVKSYFEWLETESDDLITVDGQQISPIGSHEGATEAFGSTQADRSVDTTEDRYMEYFRREYMETMPQDPLASRKTLVKRIKDYYRAKGTENSIKFLFRILYDSAANLYYPSRDLLRVSDGKWVEEYNIKILYDSGAYPDLPGTAPLLLGKTTSGDAYSAVITSGSSSAVVESVRSVTAFHTGSFYELILGRESITGAFTVGSTVTGVISTGETITGIVQAVITEPTITFKGSGYSKGTVFSIREGDSNGTIIVSGTVKTIDSVGGVLTTKLNSYPVYETAFVGNLFVDFAIEIPHSANTPGGTITTGSTTVNPGYYIGEDGFPSSSKMIQDNYYWQDYSYEIRSPIAIDTYYDLLHKALHPAGMQAFALVVGTVGSVDEVLTTTYSTTVELYHPSTNEINWNIQWTTINPRPTTATSQPYVLYLSEVDFLNVYELTYGDITLVELHGWRVWGPTENIYYPDLINKTLLDLLNPASPSVGLAPYTPGSGTGAGSTTITLFDPGVGIGTSSATSPVAGISSAMAASAASAAGTSTGDAVGQAVTAYTNIEGAKFNGDGFATYIARYDDTNTDGTLTGASDDSQGILSFWVKIPTDDSNFDNMLFSSGNPYFPTNMGQVFTLSPVYDYFGTNLDILAYTYMLDLKDKVITSTPQKLLSIRGEYADVNQMMLTGVWSHVLISWDTNYSAGNKLYKIYINDVYSDETTWPSVDADGAFNVGFSCFNWYLNYLNSAPDTEYADVYLNTTEYLDLTTESNRRKFITAGKKPVDLGSDGSAPTGNAPTILFHLNTADAATQFAVNRGTGGDFRITGTLSVSSTSPAD